MTLLKVIIRDAENLVYEGDVERISSFNEMGAFDLFPMHANFISLISKEIVLYKNKQKIKEIKIEQAVMKVQKDIVHIFLGMEEYVIDEGIGAQQSPPASVK